MIDDQLQRCRTLIDEVRQLRAQISQLSNLSKYSSGNSLASYQINESYQKIEKLREKLTAALTDLGIDPGSITDFVAHPENAKSAVDRLERKITDARTAIRPTPVDAPEIKVEPKRRLSRPNISPSQMKRHSESLIGWATDQYVKASAPKKLELNSAQVGKEVHAALEAGFNHIMKVKRENPHADVSKRAAQILDQAEAIAKSKLIFNASRSTDRIGFIREQLRSLGMGLLTNEKSVAIPEVPVESYSVHDKYTVGGRMDLLTYDEITKKVSVVDWKDWGDFKFTNMSSEAALKNEWQTKVYALTAHEHAAKVLNLRPEDIKGLSVTYAINNKALLASGSSIAPSNGKSKTVTLDITENDLTQFRKDVREKVQDIDLFHTRADFAVRATGTDGVKALISDIMKKGQCFPSKKGCAGCPAAYICPTSLAFKSMVDAVVANADAESVFLGNLDDGLMKENTVDQVVGNLETYHATDITKARQQFLAQFKSAGMDGKEAARQARAQGDALKASYDFQRNLIRSQNAAQTFMTGLDDVQLPFSIFDEEFRPYWMTGSLQRGLRANMRAHVDAFCETINFEHPNVIRDELIDKLGRSKEFQKNLYESIHEKAIDYMYREGVDLSKLDPRNPEVRTLVTKATRSYTRTLTNSALTTVQSHLEAGVIEHVLTMDKSILEQHVSADELAVYAKGRNMAAIAGVVKERTGFAPDVDKRRIDLSSGSNFDSLLAKFRLSKTTRFPFAAGIATFVLTYMAAAASVHNTAVDKIRKAAEVNAMDDTVDDGTHAGFYQTAWRLVSSDFGSAFRPFLNVSSIISGVKTWGADVIASIKTAMQFGAAAERSAAYQGANAVRESAGPLPEELRKVRQQAAKVIGITGGFSAVVGFLPALLPYDEGTNAKVAARTQPPQSRMFEASSDQRREMKKDSPFGSPMVDMAKGAWRLCRSLLRTDVETYVGELAAKTRYAQYVTKGAETLRLQTTQIEQATGTSIDVLKRSVGTRGLRAANAEQSTRHVAAAVTGMSHDRQVIARAELGRSMESMADVSLDRAAQQAAHSGLDGIEELVRRRHRGITPYVHPETAPHTADHLVAVTHTKTPAAIPDGVASARQSTTAAHMPEYPRHFSQGRGRVKSYTGPAPIDIQRAGDMMLPAMPSGPSHTTKSNLPAAGAHVSFAPPRRTAGDVPVVPDAGAPNMAAYGALTRINRIGFSRQKTVSYPTTPVMGGR